MWAAGTAPPAAPAASPLPDNLAANPLFFMVAGTNSEEEAAELPGPSGALAQAGWQGGNMARHVSSMAAEAPAAAVCRDGRSAEGIGQQQVQAATRKVTIVKQRQRGGGRGGGGKHAASAPLLGKRRASLCGASADAEERAPKQQCTAGRRDGPGTSWSAPKSSPALQRPATAKPAGAPQSRSAGAARPVHKSLAAKHKTTAPKPAAAAPKPPPFRKPSASTKPTASPPGSSSAAAHGAALKPANRPLPAPALLTERQRRAEEAWAARMRAAAAKQK